MNDIPRTYIEDYKIPERKIQNQEAAIRKWEGKGILIPYDARKLTEQDILKVVSSIIGEPFIWDMNSEKYFAQYSNDWFMNIEEGVVSLRRRYDADQPVDAISQVIKWRLHIN